VIGEAAASDEIGKTPVHLGLESGEIFGQRECAIDGFGLGLSVKEGLHSIDAALIDENVLATTNGGHRTLGRGLLHT
jgi:hypothetical protein